MAQVEQPTRALITLLGVGLSSSPVRPPVGDRCDAEPRDPLQSVAALDMAGGAIVGAAHVVLLCGWSAACWRRAFHRSSARQRVTPSRSGSPVSGCPTAPWRPDHGAARPTDLPGLFAGWSRRRRPRSTFRPARRCRPRRLGNRQHHADHERRVRRSVVGRQRLLRRPPARRDERARRGRQHDDDRAPQRSGPRGLRCRLRPELRPRPALRAGSEARPLALATAVPERATAGAVLGFPGGGT